MIPMMASRATHPAARCEAPGKSGRQKRIMPYVPIFSMTEASITEPAVGASTCASGSHVCNGNSGTLMAKATKNARNSSVDAVVVAPDADQEVHRDEADFPEHVEQEKI